MNKLTKLMYTGKLIPVSTEREQKIAKAINRRVGNAVKSSVSRKMDIRENRIAFTTYQGKYTCNPKAICEKLVQTGAPVEICWLVNKNTFTYPPADIPKGVKLFRKGSPEALDVVATSKVWVDNAGTMMWSGMPKKEGQILFQTWHGSMGLKRIDSNEDASWLKKMVAIGRATDYCISNSTFEDEVFRTSYWKNSEILGYGHARNDILFDESAVPTMKAAINDMYHILPYDRWKDEYYGSLDDLRICLYAPTFRSDTTVVKEVDFGALIDALEKKFGHKWVVLDRRHFHNRDTGRKSAGDTRVIDVTAYPDMQDLMVIADVGITDYSSWICDFVLTGRPGFIYADDLDEYEKNDRGFYYPLSETPFPLARTMDELTRRISDFDETAYEAGCKRFLEARGCREDGKAAERVVAKILEVMGLSDERKEGYL